MAKKVDISVIVTAHTEGLIAHKTILSLIKSIELLKDKYPQIKYEIIINLDKSNQETIDYYSRYSDDNSFALYQTNYGNVADARNYAINKARGKYIALIDGDDMVSSNWLLKAYELALTKNGDYILHPNIQIQFDMDLSRIGLWIMGDTLGRERDRIIMTQFNRWVSTLFAPKTVFNTVHYRPPINGYGYEDYLFNADTTAKNILHYIVPETSFYYRRSSNNKQSEHIRNNTILGYTQLFEFTEFGDNPKDNEVSNSHGLVIPSPKRIVNKIVHSRVARSIYSNCGKSIKVKVRKYVYNRQKSKLPQWLISQWKEINQIDNSLWPTEDVIINLDYHPISFDQGGAVATRVGNKYSEIVSQFTKKPDYIFFTYDPLGAGGTEKVLINYINSLKQVHPDWHFAIMRKRPDDFPFHVPDGVDFIDFYGLINGMHPWEQSILLDRVIIQSQVKHLHFFFNGWARGDYSYNWVRQHREFLKKNNYKVYVSWFMREYVLPSESGRIMSFADPYLGEIYDCVTKIFTDNQTVIDQTIANNAFDENKFAVHRQPMSAKQFNKPRRIDSNKPLRVLWASRLSNQKRPDILRKIAESASPTDIMIDVYGREQDYSGNYLKDIPTLKYKGYFNGFNSLPLDDYDVFLYTSQVDGMPNVLLEATVAGLPIVASNDGGVGELVKNNRTGKLVELEDISGYVEALLDIKNNPDKAQKYVQSAQKIVASDYTQQAFDSNVQRDIV